MAVVLGDYDEETKIKMIFQLFDKNEDGHLDKNELMLLVANVNPRTNFSHDQISGLIDKIFASFSEYVSPGKGLSYDGLKRSYADGAGDINRDFTTLKLPESLEEKLETDVQQSDEKKEVEKPEDLAREIEYKYPSTLALIEDLEIELNRRERVDAKGKREIVITSELSNSLALFRLRADGESDDAAVEGHMAMGRILLKRNVTEESILSFNKAIAFNPDDARAHFLCGTAYFAMGQLFEAQDEFENALAAANSDPQANQFLLPKIHVNVGIVYEAQGLLINASEQYNEAVLLNPHRPEFLKFLGSAYLGLGEIKDAEKALKNALTLKEDYPDALCDLGITMQLSGDLDLAEKLFEAAIRLDPNHIQAYYNYAALLRDRGEFEPAIEMYSTVLELDPKFWRAELNRAVSFLGLKRWKEAQQGFQRVFRSTKRVEVYDAIKQLKYATKLNKKMSAFVGSLPTEDAQRAQEGAEEEPDMASFASAQTVPCLTAPKESFKVAGRKMSSPAEVASALDILSFQRVTRMYLCDVEKLRLVLEEASMDSETLERAMPKGRLELQLQQHMVRLNPEPFTQVIKTLNLRIFKHVGENGVVNLALFLAIVAFLCKGSWEQRKKVAYVALTNRGVQRKAMVSEREFERFVRIVRDLLVRPVEEVKGALKLVVEPMGDDSMLNLAQFSWKMDEVFPEFQTFLKLEQYFGTSHGDLHCASCAIPVVGLRYRETTKRFNLCSKCYSECRVPVIYKQDSYVFKECTSAHDSLKDRLAALSFMDRS